MAEDNYFSVPGVASVRWDEANQTVTVTWDGWANSEEFQAILESEVQAMQDHSGSRLLADCRRQRILNPEAQEKASQEWMPKAIAAGLKRFAVVLPVNEMAASHLQQRLAAPPQPVEVGFFASVDEAQQWLDS